MEKLKISYAEMDKAIKDLKILAERPEDIYIKLGKVTRHFSTSNSDMANEMVAALSRYREVYNLMLELCRNAANMLTTAKYLYEDMDVGQSEEIEN